MDDINRASWWQAALMIRGQTEADQRNIRAVWVWCFLWAAGSVAAVAALRFLEPDDPFAWLVASVPLFLFLGAARACLRFIREADEFMRKVQLEGIALGFAAGSLFSMAYPFLERAGAPPLPLIVTAVPLMVGWAVGSFIVAYRHR